MRSRLLCLVIFFIPFSEGAIGKNHKLDWMFLKREENSAKYRIKDEAPYGFAYKAVNKYQPIYLDAEFNLMIPTTFIDNKIVMQISEPDKPICKSSSASKNDEMVYKTQPDFAKQHSRGNIPLYMFPRNQEESTIYDKKALGTCRFVPMPSVKLSSKKVRNVCDVYKVGYTIDTSSLDSKTKKNFASKFPSKLVPLYEACYSQKDETTHYTYHQLLYKGMDKRQLNPNIKEFEFPETRKFYDYVADIYNLDKQFHSYNFFNSEPSKFQMHSEFLVPVYLVPMHDMLFESWQIAISEIMNIAPQWRRTNLDAWLRVEEFVRLMAWRYQTNLHVFTGVLYNKFLPSSSSSSIKSGHRIKKKSNNQDVPIPNHFYKYIVDEKYERGIVLVVPNGDEIKLLPIENICPIYGWKHGYGHRIGCHEASTFFKYLSYTIPDLKYPNDIMTFMKNIAPEIQPEAHTNVFSQQLARNPREVREMNEHTHLWEFAQYFKSRSR